MLIVVNKTIPFKHIYPSPVSKRHRLTYPRWCYLLIILCVAFVPYCAASTGKTTMTPKEELSHIEKELAKRHHEIDNSLSKVEKAYPIYKRRNDRESKLDDKETAKHMQVIVNALGQLHSLQEKLSILKMKAENEELSSWSSFLSFSELLSEQVRKSQARARKQYDRFLTRFVDISNEVCPANSSTIKYLLVLIEDQDSLSKKLLKQAHSKTLYSCSDPSDPQESIESFLERWDKWESKCDEFVDEAKEMELEAIWDCFSSLEKLGFNVRTNIKQADNIRTIVAYYKALAHKQKVLRSQCKSAVCDAANKLFSLYDGKVKKYRQKPPQAKSVLQDKKTLNNLKTDLGQLETVINLIEKNPILSKNVTQSCWRNKILRRKKALGKLEETLDALESTALSKKIVVSKSQAKKFDVKKAIVVINPSQDLVDRLDNDGINDEDAKKESWKNYIENKIAIFKLGNQAPSVSQSLQVKLAAQLTTLGKRLNGLKSMDDNCFKKLMESVESLEKQFKDSTGLEMKTLKQHNTLKQDPLLASLWSMSASTNIDSTVLLGIILGLFGACILYYVYLPMQQKGCIVHKQ